MPALDTVSPVPEPGRVGPNITGRVLGSARPGFWHRRSRFLAQKKQCRQLMSMESNRPGLRAVLLDVDGTLIDSNDAHARAWVDTGDEFDRPIQFGEVRWLVGMGGDRVLPRLTGLTEDSDEGARMLERRGEIFRERYLPQLEPFPRVRELLERLRADGLRLVVATSAGSEDLSALLKQAGIEDLIDAATSSDDADSSKPAPDIVAAALEQAGAPADRVAMLGDTPYDVKAAQRAGVPLIALRCGGWTDAELRGAVEVYRDPAELLERYDDSLLGTRSAPVRG
jgi:HAD superfamily hydrolase (TIGR01509 family)